MRKHNLSNPFIKFTKEGESKSNEKVISGYNARAEYEDIINQNFEKYTIPTATAPSSHSSKPKRKPKVKPILSSINVLLREIQNGNVDQVSKILNGHNVNINDTDDFGWTPLMCASCAGNVEIVSILLQLKPDMYVTDRKCNTALSLAKRNKHYDIVKLLTMEQESERVQTTMQQNNISDSSTDKTYCNLCKKLICNRDLDLHERTNAHMYHEQITHGTYPIVMTKRHTFSIQRSNKGYQMLLRNGWTGNCGLGPSGKGVVTPIRTIMKKDRKGLGLKTNNTLSNMHKNLDNSTAEQITITNKRADEKIKEISLRRMLS